MRLGRDVDAEQPERGQQGDRVLVLGHDDRIHAHDRARARVLVAVVHWHRQLDVVLEALIGDAVDARRARAHREGSEGVQLRLAAERRQGRAAGEGGERMRRRVWGEQGDHHVSQQDPTLADGRALDVGRGLRRRRQRVHVVVRARLPEPGGEGRVVDLERGRLQQLHAQQGVGGAERGLEPAHRLGAGDDADRGEFVAAVPEVGDLHLGREGEVGDGEHRAVQLQGGHASEGKGHVEYP